MYPVNVPIFEEAGQYVLFNSTLNDLAGGSAKAYLQRVKDDGTYVTLGDDDSADVYSGEDEWEGYLGYGGDEESRFEWDDWYILYDHCRVAIEYTYPDGTEGEWYSEPFHIAQGYFTGTGTASYDKTTGDITAVFPVWDKLDPDQITLDQWRLMYWETWEETTPEIVEISGSTDSEGKNWLTIVAHNETPLAPGGYMFSIDPKVDTDENNPWIDNTTAGFEVSE